MDPRLQAIRGDTNNRNGSVGSNALAFREMFRNPDASSPGASTTAGPSYMSPSTNSSFPRPSYSAPQQEPQFHRPDTNSGPPDMYSGYDNNSSQQQTSHYTPSQQQQSTPSMFSAPQPGQAPPTNRGSDPGSPPVAGQFPPQSQPPTTIWSSPAESSEGPASAEVQVTDADISQLQNLQVQLPPTAISSGELRAGVILKLGGKKPFFQWQWRRCVVTLSGKMQYYDPKKQKNSIRGELALKGAIFETINENHSQFARLKKFSEKVENNAISYFSIKPGNVTKTYFFAVPTAEREEWLKALRTSEKAEALVREQQALQLKMQYARQQEYLKMQQQRQAKIGGGIERSQSSPSGLAASPPIPHSQSMPPISNVTLPLPSGFQMRPPSDPLPAQSITNASNPSRHTASGLPPFQQNPQPHQFASLGQSTDAVRPAAGSAGSNSSATATPRGDENSMSDLLAFSYSKAPEAGTDAQTHSTPQQPAPQMMLPRRSVSGHPDLALPDLNATAMPIDDFTFDSPDEAAASASQPMPAGTSYDSSLPGDVQMWSPSQVALFVTEIGLAHYSELFVSQNISGWNVANFSVDDLGRYTGIPPQDSEFILSSIHHKIQQFYSTNSSV